MSKPKARLRADLEVKVGWREWELYQLFPYLWSMVPALSHSLKDTAQHGKEDIVTGAALSLEVRACHWQ